MTEFQLSPAAHQTLLQQHALMRSVPVNQRECMESSGTFDAEAREVIQQTEAFVERVRDMIDRLAGGLATAADVNHFCEIATVKCTELRRWNEEQMSRIAILRGIDALYELGSDGGPVTVN